METLHSAGPFLLGKRIGTHTLRHSYARHYLLNGVPINHLSRWLGHSSIQTTLIYLELVLGPTGSVASIPLSVQRLSLTIRTRWLPQFRVGRRA